MSKSWEISRRTVLRGLGTAIALPWLEAMRPAARALASNSGAPRRMAFLYVPNGVHMQDWTPSAEGPLGTLPHILESLEPFQGDFSVLTGLAQRGGEALGDGPGDHARGLSSFLTGAHPVKTDGANIKVGVSVDQVAARKVGASTRLPSLELGCDPSAQAGSCDSGYSCAYSSNISWRSESLPMAKEVNPKAVFERLFSREGAGEDVARRNRYRRSVLDFAREDARGLSSRLGGADRRKVEEYLTAVRELEVRVARAGVDPAPPDGATRPEGVPKEFPEHVRLMCDMMALAFQGDVTRVSTFVLANEGSTRAYPFIGVPDGHHDVSHHGGNAEKHAKIRKINRFHIEQFAYLLGKLKSIREGEATLLDNCMIVYGSGIGDGDRHNHHDLPILVAGKGGGTIAQGPPPQVREAHALEQPLPVDARPDRRPDRGPGRQQGSAAGPGRLIAGPRRGDTRRAVRLGMSPAPEGPLPPCPPASVSCSRSRSPSSARVSPTAWPTTTRTRSGRSRPRGSRSPRRIARRWNRP